MSCACIEPINKDRSVIGRFCNQGFVKYKILFLKQLVLYDNTNQIYMTHA